MFFSSSIAHIYTRYMRYIISYLFDFSVLNSKIPVITGIHYIIDLISNYTYSLEWIWLVIIWLPVCVWPISDLKVDQISVNFINLLTFLHPVCRTLFCSAFWLHDDSSEESTWFQFANGIQRTWILLNSVKILLKFKFCFWNLVSNKLNRCRPLRVKSHSSFSMAMKLVKQELA